MRRLLKRFLLAALLAGAMAVVLIVIHVSMPGWYARWWYPIGHADDITANAARYQLDPALVAAVIYQESSFEGGSTSPKGAVGLMQLMPATAGWIAAQEGSSQLSPAKLSDPSVNISFGCWYLRYLLDRYGSVDLALAAYNGGIENVDDWLETARQTGREFSSILDIPWRETREYVSHVGETRDIYARAYPTELGLQ